MSTLSKRTLLMLLILSISIGSVFAEGQADMFDNDNDYSVEDRENTAIDGDTDDIENESFNGFSGMMGRGNGMSAPHMMREGKGELKYVDAPGVLVADVFIDSPADDAGILRGDVIIAVDGVDISTIHDIILVLEGYEHGQSVELILLRADKEMNINLTLETRIGYPLIGITGIGSETGNRNGMDGFDMPFFGDEMMPGHGPAFMFEFEDGESDDFSMMEIPEEVIEAVITGNTALITEVVAGSPAEEAGISVNMVVIALNGNNLEEGDLSKAVLAYEIGEKVELTLANLSGVLTLEVELGDNNGNPFLGVAYIPLDLGEQGFGMPFNMPGQRDGVFQNRPNMMIPKMNNN